MCRNVKCLLKGVRNKLLTWTARQVGVVLLEPKNHNVKPLAILLEWPWQTLYMTRKDYAITLVYRITKLSKMCYDRLDQQRFISVTGTVFRQLSMYLISFSSPSSSWEAIAPTSNCRGCSRYPSQMYMADLPTLPHWAEAFRISRPASDLPHLLKIFRFQLKSDQHVFPVWTLMQLTWQSNSYHDHSSLSCPLISWGTVKTETLPALCNKNNKPIDLIHLRCGWQLTLLRERKGIYGVLGKCSPRNFVPHRKCVFPKHAHSSQFKHRLGLRLSH